MKNASRTPVPDSRLWFAAKHYGWGWTPVTWEGWTLTSVFIAVQLAIVFGTESLVHSWREWLLYTLLPMAIVIVLFIIICYRTGEKPRWRWG